MENNKKVSQYSEGLEFPTSHPLWPQIPLLYTLVWWVHRDHRQSHSTNWDFDSFLVSLLDHDWIMKTPLRDRIKEWRGRDTFSPYKPCKFLKIRILKINKGTGCKEKHAFRYYTWPFFFESHQKVIFHHHGPVSSFFLKRELR